MADPYNNQKMTYSEIVHLLSSFMVPAFEDEAVEGSGNPQMTSILEKFVNIRTGGSYLEAKSITSNNHHLNQSHVSRISEKQNINGGVGGQDDIR